MEYWKPTKSSIYIPLPNKTIHILEKEFKYLHPGYMDQEIYLEGANFLLAENLIGYSVAHCYYASLMKSKEKAITVIESSSVAIAREKASYYKPRPDWKWHSVALMEDIIYRRFRRLTNKECLISTWPYAILPYIDKGNTFWGCRKTKYGYLGFNVIGKALMRYRQWLML